jgi:hypothetical protein
MVLQLLFTDVALLSEARALLLGKTGARVGAHPWFVRSAPKGKLANSIPAGMRRSSLSAGCEKPPVNSPLLPESQERSIQRACGGAG